VKVYDVKGRLVRSLADDRRAAGHHTLTWDGRTAGGRMAASGVYYLRLEAGGEPLVRPMLLMK
jgi:flagellar hook assembly protein FlgD